MSETGCADPELVGGGGTVQKVAKHAHVLHPCAGGLYVKSCSVLPNCIFCIFTKSHNTHFVLVLFSHQV